MATRIRTKVTRRPSLPLTETDEDALATIRTTSAFSDALARLSPDPIDPATATEAALLHAIFQAGVAALRDAAEVDGYAQVAAEQQADDSAHRSAARRRPPSWVNEQ